MTYLKEHQVSVGQPATVQPGPVAAGFGLEHSFKVRQELWQPVLDVILGLPFALVLLVFIVQPRRDGMVAVVRLVAQPVQGGQRQRVDPIDGVRVLSGVRQESQPRS